VDGDGPANNMNRIASVSDAVKSRALTWNEDGNLYQEVRTSVGGGAPKSSARRTHAASGVGNRPSTPVCAGSMVGSPSFPFPANLSSASLQA